MTTSIATINASIDTLAVTIQALHVDRKQMTLAVFRQLPVRSAYADDGSLAPLVHWGTVRYVIRDEGDYWLVASADGILYRCPATMGSQWDAESRGRHLERAIAALKTHDDAQREIEAYDDALRLWRDIEMRLKHDCPITPEMVTHERDKYDQAVKAGDKMLETLYCCHNEQSQYRRRERWIRDRLPGPPPVRPNVVFTPGARDGLAAAVKAERARMRISERAAKSAALIAALPQLYIAV